MRGEKRKKKLSYHVGLGEKFRHNSKRNILTDAKVSFFLGTRTTERALLHFFEPSKVGEKFDYHPPEMSLPADTSIAVATAEENNQELNPQPEMTQSTPSNGPEYISLYPTDNVSVKLKFCSFTHYTRQSWLTNAFESTLHLW